MLGLGPVQVDQLGLDYCPQSEWWYDGSGSRAPSPHPVGLAALAAPQAGVPVYRFQQPVASRLAGFLPQMSHWPWTDPPPWERVPPVDLRPAALSPPISVPTARSA